MKVLFVMTSLGNGGVEKMIMSWIAGFNNHDIQVDIIAQGIEDYDNKKSLEKLGCKVYNMPFRYRQLAERKQFLEEVLSKKNYDIIHVHTCTSLDYLCLKIAYKYNVKIRIAHSHSSGLGKVPAINYLLHWINKPRLRKYATAYFACSTEAAIHLFGKNAIKSNKMFYIPNGIDTKKFMFSIENRKRIREKYNLNENTLVMGFVGRYDPQKHHDYTVKVLKEITDIGISCHLFLIGDGTCREKVMQLADSLDVKKYITFINFTSKVNEYLSAMDIMLFPSIREGLSVALVEAQCSGLNCVISNTISKETVMTKGVYMLPVNDKALPRWRDLCLKIGKNVLKNRVEGYKAINSNGYDIYQSTNKIINIYNSLLKGLSCK